MARIIIEVDVLCAHGRTLSHLSHDDGVPGVICVPGVDTTLVDLDGLPSRSIEAAAVALSVEICGYDESDDDGCMAQHRSEAEAAIRAFLADLEQGEQ